MNPTYKNLPGNILSNNKASYLKSGSNMGTTRGDNMFNDISNNRTKNGFGINNDNFAYNNQNTLGNKRTQQDELNEANESLKLLRLKNNNNNTPLGQPNNNNFGISRSNLLTNNFQGNFNKNSNLIEINKNEFVKNNNPGNPGPRIMNNNTNKNPIAIPNKKAQVEEVVDDRPAFNEKGEDIYESDYLDEQEEEDEEEDPSLSACMHCGRRFKDETLEKHEQICQKIFCTQRKKFDIKKKRVLDSEHAMLLKRSEREGVDKKLLKVKEQKKQKWKKMSEEFRSIVKSTATDGFGDFGNNGKPNPPVKSVIEEDYKHCELCNRKYNENAYDKHLPSCERRAKEAQLKNKGKPGTGSGSMMTANTTSYANSKPNLNLKFNKK